MTRIILTSIPLTYIYMTRILLTSIPLIYIIHDTYYTDLNTTNIHIHDTHSPDTKVVSSNPVHGEVYSIQYYVITFVRDLRQIGGFLRFPPPIKLTAIAEILLKVALSTINQTNEATILPHSCTYKTTCTSI
jgi:hypothetical protein